MGKKFIILVIILFAIVLILFFGLSLKTPRELKITTNRTEYASGEAPIMTIKNNLTSNICLSDCYPYYLEKNDGEWQAYLYEKCDKPDLVRDCIEPNQEKSLELIIQALQSGSHRIAVPACLNCQVGQAFREDQRFHSNEFIIK